MRTKNTSNTESTTGTSMLAALEQTCNHIAKAALQQLDEDVDRANVAPQQADEGVAPQRPEHATPQCTHDMIPY